MRENFELHVRYTEREAAALFAAAKFMKSASKVRECPEDEGFEVAFAGRSNAGKSSALNALAAHHKLARTSKTPGRTQLLNFFSLTTADQRLVDLPGYGYAKVPEEMKLKWQAELDRYLQSRQSLAGLVLLMDIRHPLQNYDKQMLNWAAKCQMPVHVLLTKADKLNRGPATEVLRKVRKELLSYSDMATIQLFSSTRGDGVYEARCQVLDWLYPADQALDDAASEA